jgi:hypothetical protein
MKKLIAALLTFIVLPYSSALCQSEIPDSSQIQPAINQAIGIYYKTIGENAHLYNGSEYLQYIVFNPAPDRNPFFQNIFMQNGTVQYDGTVYHEVPMTYDVYKDVLVSLRYNWNYRIKLVTDKVGFFDLAGHHFVLINEDSTANLPDGAGFYEELYTGKALAVLAKRKKKKEERLYSAEFTTYFFQNDHYYIRKGGNYYPVNSKSNLLDVLQDKKKEIRKYLRKNNISYKASPEHAIVSAADYYDQIKN